MTTEQQLALVDALILAAKRRWLRDRTVPVQQHFAAVVRDCGFRFRPTPQGD